MTMTENVVRTRYGDVRGTGVDGVVAFKNIPYAAPPFGPNRFQPPRPVTPWDGVRDASRQGPTVVKPPYFPPFDILIPEPSIPGEDCLNLNIWTPEPGETGLPVLVWIHGGAFQNGSNALETYDGTRFARDGVVCVVINYRLGVDGFLYLGDGISNLGLLDQVAAVEWVHENIKVFGGDPSNVTVAGQSAGAMSATTLLSMPRAAGLFRRLIAQSGSGYYVISPATAQKIGGYLAEKLGVPATREAIGAVPFEQLVQAQMALSAEAFTQPDPARWGEVAATQMPFEPVIDGDVVPGRPIDRIAGGAGATVDLLVGSNSEEENLFMVPNGFIDAITPEVLKGTIAAYGLPVDKTLEVYGAHRPGATPGELMAAVITDWYFRIPAIRLSEAQSKGPGTAYMYEFRWRSPLYNGRLGACHSLEIQFAFDNLDKDNAQLGTGNPQQIADVMHAAWVSFIKTGEPGWPQYDLNSRPTMVFNLESGVEDDPRGAERELWTGLR